MPEIEIIVALSLFGIVLLVLSIEVANLKRKVGRNVAPTKKSKYLSDRLPKVYIASPYSLGDKEKNVQVQVETASKLLDMGFNPFWPLASHYLHSWKKQTYDTWMEIDLEWLESCDYLLRLPGESKGADMEVAHARKLGIPVFYSIEQLLFYCTFDLDSNTNWHWWKYQTTTKKESKPATTAVV